MKGNEDENGKDVKLDNYDVEFKNVTFGYDSRTVLKDVSFRIPEKNFHRDSRSLRQRQNHRLQPSHKVLRPAERKHNHGRARP